MSTQSNFGSKCYGHKFVDDRMFPGKRTRHCRSENRWWKAVKRQHSRDHRRLEKEQIRKTIKEQDHEFIAPIVTNDYCW